MTEMEKENVICLKTEEGYRIAYIDTAKTVCIVLMVIGHWTDNNTLLTYIYSFHMPAFFIISGLLYKPHHWLKTILSFGIPVLFYSLIHLGILIITDNYPPELLSYKGIIKSILCYRYGLNGICLFVGVWFIWALLGLRLLFGDIKANNIIRKWYVIISTFIAVYISLEHLFIETNTIFRGWFVGCKTIQCVPFFCLGIYLKEKKWKPEKISLSTTISLMMLALSLPIINGKCGILETEYGLSYMLFCLTSFVITLLLFKVAYYIPPNRFCTTISKGTLLILGVHFPLLLLLSRLSVVPECINFLLPFIVVLICFYPIEWLYKKCPALLGKIK